MRAKCPKFFKQTPYTPEIKTSEIYQPKHRKSLKSQKFERVYIYVWETSGGKQLSDDEIEAKQKPIPVSTELDRSLGVLASIVLAIFGLYMIFVIQGPSDLGRAPGDGILGLFLVCCNGIGVLLVIWSVFMFSSSIKSFDNDD